MIVAICWKHIFARREEMPSGEKVILRLAFFNVKF